MRSMRSAQRHMKLSYSVGKANSVCKVVTFCEFSVCDFVGIKNMPGLS